MGKTTIIVAHPNWKESKAIKQIIKSITAKIDSIDIRILNKDGKFNIKKEQEYLLKYNNIIYAFPLWWYSPPWILKKYFDDILESGFAFDYSGNTKKFKLMKKRFSYIVSTGNVKQVYKEGKANLHTITRFLDPLHAIFHLLSTGGVMIHNKPKQPKEYMFTPHILYGAEVSTVNNEKEIDLLVKNFLKKIPR